MERRDGSARIAPTVDTDEVTTSGSSHNHPHFLRSVIRWLQAGYPEGVPGPDRVPLFALLRSTPLTPDQLKEVVSNLTSKESPAAADGMIDGNEIAGWPLAGIDVSEVIPGDEDGEAAEEIAAQLRAASQR
jgi:hypothetical protein